MSSGVFASTIAPWAGCTLSNVMWSTPLFLIWEAKRLREVGVINPLPFIMGCYCCSGWVLYGSLKHDGFIIWANFPGLAVATYCCLNVYALLILREAKAEEDEGGNSDAKGTASFDPLGGSKVALVNNRESDAVVTVTPLQEYKRFNLMVETALWGSPAIWGLLTYLSWVVWSTQKAIDVVGWVCVFLTVIYFFAPLIAVREVIRLKDASSIYPPSILTNALNCTMWMIYGFVAVKDPVVWGPNVLGLVLQFINTLLILKYPRLLAKVPINVPVAVPTTAGTISVSEVEDESSALRSKSSDDFESAGHRGNGSDGSGSGSVSSDATLRRRAVSDQEKDVNALTARL